MADEKNNEFRITPEIEAELERVQKLADAVPDVVAFTVDMRMEPVEGKKGLYELIFRTSLPRREALHLGEHIEYALQEFVAEVGGKGVGERVLKNLKTGEVTNEKVDFGDPDFETKLAKKVSGNGKPN